MTGGREGRGREDKRPLGCRNITASYRCYVCCPPAFQPSSPLSLSHFFPFAASSLPYAPHPVVPALPPALSPHLQLLPHRCPMRLLSLQQCPQGLLSRVKPKLGLSNRRGREGRQQASFKCRRGWYRTRWKMSRGLLSYLASYLPSNKYQRRGDPSPATTCELCPCPCACLPHLPLPHLPSFSLSPLIIPHHLSPHLLQLALKHVLAPCAHALPSVTLLPKAVHLQVKRDKCTTD